MKFAIMESVVTPGGHEIDFDRILVEELTALGHEVEFYVPEKHAFKWNYGVPVNYVPGTGISYAGAKGLKKLYLSIKRELHRQQWYKAMYDNAVQKKFDAIIFPSATYRYLRALKRSALKKSPVPVLFLMHGLTPKECGKLNEEMQSFKGMNNIRIGVQTFAGKKLSLNNTEQIRIYNPPNYLARDINKADYNNDKDVLKIGFFGQYRKEKKLEEFLDCFVHSSFERPVKLIVQGATQTVDDEQDFKRIIDKYKKYEMVEFWHKALIGIEWQKGLAAVDAIAIPYGNDRYLYHTSAILSNAIGFGKEVIIADNVNPEVWQQYNIGVDFKNGDLNDLRQKIVEFVNTYDEKKAVYEQELLRAYNDFSPALLAKNIAELAGEGADKQ